MVDDTATRLDKAEKGLAGLRPAPESVPIITEARQAMVAAAKALRGKKAEEPSIGAFGQPASPDIKKE